MFDILHDLPIKASPARVFEYFSTPQGLDQWWTLRSKGTARLGEEYELWFGAGYDWRARVTACVPDVEFELEMTHAMDDWMGTRVGVTLKPTGSGTEVSFHHSSWAEATPHFRTSSCCWAMYLRILRRHIEYGEVVPYDERLEV